MRVKGDPSTALAAPKPDGAERRQMAEDLAARPREGQRAGDGGAILAADGRSYWLGDQLLGAELIAGNGVFSHALQGRAKAG